MLVSLTVGKVDAGVAVLLTEDKRHIEFPSILLPPTIACGSIVDIQVKQNHAAEEHAESSFNSLQENILNTYGLVAPTAPVLRLRNATQTSLVLEWDPIQLATSTLRSLALYRNGSKAGNIPRPLEMLSTKISGLPIDTEFSFYLVLRTSGGTYQSNTLTVRTQKMTDLTGITVTPGVLPPAQRDALDTAVQRIGAKIVDSVRIDTTHFVCTEGRGKEWEKAVEMSIPVVRPEWIEGCEREGKIVGVRGYYLDANPKHRQIGSNPQFTPQQESARPTPSQQNSQTSLPQRPKTPEPEPAAEREVEGEPGPEVPPTPPAKDASRAGHEAEPGAAADREDEDSDDYTPVTAIGEQPRTSIPTLPREGFQVEDDEDDENEYDRSAHRTSSTGHDRRGGDASGEMEDVAL